MSPKMKIFVPVHIYELDLAFYVAFGIMDSSTVSANVQKLISLWIMTLSYQPQPASSQYFVFVHGSIVHFAILEI